ncbi:MAG TPA: GAP family protein, partial [archaeon]|nr:GAP family protein [archaeon]
AVEASIPTVGAIVVSALIDSINPCAIGVLILLISIMIANSRLRKQMIWTGSLYIFAVFTTYFMAGLGLTVFFHVIPLSIAEYISIVVGTLIVIGGLVEIKDYFWYGQGISLAIPPERAKQIEAMAQNLTSRGVILLGAFVALVELPCTGGPYLAVTLLLSQTLEAGNLLSEAGAVAVGLLFVYNVLFIAPLLVILGLVLAGTKIQYIKQWKQMNRAYMRLAIGVLLVALGWLLMLIANGTISLA